MRLSRGTTLAHLPHDAEAAAEVREGRGVRVPEDGLVRGASAANPLRVELLAVGGHQVPVLEERPLLDLEKRRRDHQQRGDEQQDRQHAIADHVELHRSERGSFVGDRVGDLGGDDRASREDDRAERLLSLGDKAQACGHIGMSRDEVEIEPGHAPQERGPQQHPPYPAQQQESEDGCRDQDEPPTRKRHLGAIRAQRVPAGDAEQLEPFDEERRQQREDGQDGLGERAIPQAGDAPDHRLESGKLHRGDQPPSRELQDELAPPSVDPGLGQDQDRKGHQEPYVHGEVAEERDLDSRPERHALRQREDEHGEPGEPGAENGPLNDQRALGPIVAQQDQQPMQRSTAGQRKALRGRASQFCHVSIPPHGVVPCRKRG